MALTSDENAELQLLDEVVSTPGLTAVVTDEFAARCGRFRETAVDPQTEINYIMQIVHPQTDKEGAK